MSLAIDFGSVVGAYRSTTLPSRLMRNLLRGHESGKVGGVYNGG